MCRIKCILYTDIAISIIHYNFFDFKHFFSSKNAANTLPPNRIYLFLLPFHQNQTANRTPIPS